jgi:hypothetical protein
MALSTTVFLTLVFAVAAHLLVRFQHERRRGKLVWGRLVIPFGKTAEWLLYFWAMVFAIDHLGKNLPRNVDSAIARTRPAQMAEPGRSTAAGARRNPQRLAITAAATKKPQKHALCGLRSGGVDDQR